MSTIITMQDDAGQVSSPDLDTLTPKQLHDLKLDLREAICNGTDGTADDELSTETIEYYEKIIAGCVTRLKTIGGSWA